MLAESVITKLAVHGMPLNMTGLDAGRVTREDVLFGMSKLSDAKYKYTRLVVLQEIEHEEDVVNGLSKELQRWAHKNRWKIKNDKEKLKAISKIAVRYMMNVGATTQVKADLLGVHRNNYARDYGGKVEDAIAILNTWEKSIENSIKRAVFD